jgi:nucleotide-binding universal stress UspA family protein
VTPGIVVPLDGTRFAEAALPLALGLAKRDGLPLQLVTVWEPVLPLYDVSGQLEAWERDRQAERRRYLADLSSCLEGLGATVSLKYLDGRPSEVLPPFASPENARLVVMATHGRSPLARAGLGSVADQVVRRGSVPVLLIRPDEDSPEVELAPAGPLRRVLVPLDGSELAEAALQRSLLAGPSGSIDLTLLRVVSFPQSADVPGVALPRGMEEAIVSGERAAARKYLHAVADRLAPWGWRGPGSSTTRSRAARS